MVKMMVNDDGSWWLIIIWLVVEPPTPLKNDGVKVSWDDELPNMMEKIKAIFQTTTQYVCMYIYIYSMFNAC